jgi:hypothetical protein
MKKIKAGQEKGVAVVAEEASRIVIPEKLTIAVEIVNRSMVVADEEANKVVSSLQIQVTRDFYPVWGVNASLKFIGRKGVPDPNKWQLIILDTTDQAGLLGYHDRTSVGNPLGKVFALSDRAHKSQWSVTASHELLEMLVDPDINLCAVVTSQGKSQFIAYECADACENDADGSLIDGVLVSDFVFPSWFETFRKEGTQYDRERKISRPLQTLAGGYLQYFDVSSGLGWQQADNLQGGVVVGLSKSGKAEDAREQRLNSRYAGRAPIGSRRERRRIDRDRWVDSDTTGGPDVPFLPVAGDTTGGPDVPFLPVAGDTTGGDDIPDQPVVGDTSGGGDLPGLPVAGDRNGGPPIPRVPVAGDINGGPDIPGQSAGKKLIHKKPGKKKKGKKG